MAPTDPAYLYLQLGTLAAQMPDLTGPGPITPEMNAWLGRAVALVELAGTTTDLLEIKKAAQSLYEPMREMSAQTIYSIVYATLSRTELLAPASAGGTFLPAGGHFQAFAAIGKVLGAATADVLIVDPYADSKILTDFAVLAPEGVRIRVLANRGSVKASLKPAAERWTQEYGSTRPLEVRLVPKSNPPLHDRSLVVDGENAWTVGQSFNALAARAPTSVLPVLDSEIGSAKISAHDQVWQGSAPL